MNREKITVSTQRKPSRYSIRQILIVICISYTIISIGVALFETIISQSDQGFSDLLFKFICTSIAICILYTHPLLERLSPLVMLLLQYAAAMLLVFLTIWISGFFETLHEQAYFHAFRSFTAIYIIGAAVYYISVLRSVKKQNRLLEEIRNSNIIRKEP